MAYYKVSPPPEVHAHSTRAASSSWAVWPAKQKVVALQIHNQALQALLWYLSPKLWELLCCDLLCPLVNTYFGCTWCLIFVKLLSILTKIFLFFGSAPCRKCALVRCRLVIGHILQVLLFFYAASKGCPTWSQGAELTRGHGAEPEKGNYGKC